MARTLRRSNTLPTWEADKLNRQARKALKQSRKASTTKRQNQDAAHSIDVGYDELEYCEAC